MAEVTVAGREKSFSTAYQWYALGVLFVVYVFNFIDRSVLALLAQSIKEDLQISDTALGLLGGLAFAVFYTGLGIPIARLADKGNRRNILVVCLSIWSAATALCGLAHSYAYLLLARIGVAVGEAGGSPPSHSMISDMFPQHRRATALGIYALGIPVGSMIGALAGGWINDAFDWRTAFMIVGLPGLLLALIVRMTLQEPPRGVSEPVRVDAGATPPIGAVFRLLWERPSFRWLSMSAGFQAFVSYGAGAWIPPMFERTHGLSSSQIGTALFWLGFASVIGTFAGGWYGDRMGRRDVRWYMWLPAWTTLAWLPFQAYCYLTSDPWLAFWVMADSELSRLVLVGAGVFADAGIGRTAHARGRSVDHVVRAEHHRDGAGAGIRRHPVGSAQHLYVARRRIAALVAVVLAVVRTGCRVLLHARRADVERRPRAQSGAGLTVTRERA